MTAISHPVLKELGIPEPVEVNTFTLKYSDPMPGIAVRIVLVFEWLEDAVNVQLSHATPLSLDTFGTKKITLDKMQELSALLAQFAQLGWHCENYSNMKEALDFVRDKTLADAYQNMKESGMPGVIVPMLGGVNPDDPALHHAISGLCQYLEKAKSEDVMLDVGPGEQLFICAESEPLSDGMVLKVLSKIDKNQIVTFKCLSCYPDKPLKNLSNGKLPLPKYQKLLADFEAQMLIPRNSKWKS